MVRFVGCTRAAQRGARIARIIVDKDIFSRVLRRVLTSFANLINSDWGTECDDSEKLAANSERCAG